MDKGIMTFGDNEIKKCKFHHLKKLILFEDLPIEKIQVSSIVSSGEKNYKYFTGYKVDDHKIKAPYIMFLKASAYKNLYDGKTKWMHFLLKMMNY